jgi:hypothetical protein
VSIECASDIDQTGYMRGQSVIQAKKWMRAERGALGLSYNLVFFDKVNLYIGRSDYWGVAVDVSPYDRSLTFRLLNIYFGVEVWHSEEK